MTSPNKTQREELLAAIQRTPVSANPSSVAPSPAVDAPLSPHANTSSSKLVGMLPEHESAQSSPRRKTTSTSTKQGTGRGTNFYFGDEEKTRIRELAAWLGSQGMRVSDSLVLKAALRIAKPNHDLLAASRAIQKEDRRFKN